MKVRPAISVKHKSAVLQKYP